MLFIILIFLNAPSSYSSLLAFEISHQHQLLSQVKQQDCLIYLYETDTNSKLNKEIRIKATTHFNKVKKNPHNRLIVLSRGKS